MNQSGARAAQAAPDQPVTLWWMARDFRFHDNEALRMAAARGAVLPVFVTDAATRSLGSAARWRLERALEAFNTAWKARTGAEITRLSGEAADLLPDLARACGADLIAQNDWPWAPAQQAQAALRRRLDGTGIGFSQHRGHLLLAPARVLAERGRVYKVYTPFARAVRQIGPELPVAAVGAIRAVASQGLPQNAPPLAPDLQRGAAVLARFAQSAGEAAALERLEDFYDMAPDYAEMRDRPDREVCSGLSEALALGEISPRYLWQSVQSEMQRRPEAAAGLQKFLSELLWREFAWHLLLDFPDLARQPWKPDWATFPWQGPNAAATAWARGATGVPLVDAGLREMRVTGRMHNRVRMVVASWLTKHLLTDWRIGEAHFADSLTDWDPAANAMNWQWVAGCGPDASPFFRIFNPAKQAETFDPKGIYRSRWLQPAQSAEARAYFDTLPASWALPALYEADDSDSRLRAGREAALAALAAHKIQLGPANG